MHYSVIVRADGGVSLFPKHSLPLLDEDGQEIMTAEERDVDTLERWKESARKEWLPATLVDVEQTLSEVEHKFHGSRNVASKRGHVADNALEWDGAKLIVNMPKARSVHMDRIRLARVPELAKADYAVQSAEDEGDAPKIKLGRANRKKLKDIPQTFDLSAARTPEDLDALWPAELPRP